MKGLRSDLVLRHAGMAVRSLKSVNIRLPAHEAIGVAALALAYFILAKLGLALASLHPSASPVWPPSGLALAAFLLWGYRVWPAIGVGAFLANATTFGSLATSLAIAAGNTAEAMLTAWLLRLCSSGAETFRTPAGVARFAALALGPGAMLSATVGVTSLVLAGHAEAAKFTGIWTTWWLGDVGGQIIVTPVIVLWATARPWRLSQAELQRLASLLAATIVVGVIAFSPLLEQTPLRGPLAFLAIVPMLWAALRHGSRHTATPALVLSTFAIWGTLAGGGPFAGPSLNESFLLTLTFVISVAVPSLVLSAEVAVRRESEEHHRALVDNANDMVATFDLDLRFTSANPAFQRILGSVALVGEPLSRFVPPHQLPVHQEMLRRKLDGESATRYEMEVINQKGALSILEMNSRLIFDEAGKPLSIHAIARDVTDRTNAEARQMLLVRELQHRTKNMLAVIQSIVSNTLVRSRDPAAAKDAVMGRLHALARAQQFVGSGPTGGVQLRNLVDAELASYASRLSIEGPPLVIGGAFAQMFALVLHELAANAAKYGSLSNTAGRLAVRWDVEGEGAEAALTFSWVESGGPAVTPPARQGFGSMLIATALSGSPRIAFEPAGFTYEITMPLSAVMKPSKPSAGEAVGEDEVLAEVRRRRSGS
jgi:PAS domain S-box-containing protein